MNADDLRKAGMREPVLEMYEFMKKNGIAVVQLTRSGGMIDADVTMEIPDSIGGSELRQPFHIFQISMARHHRLLRKVAYLAMVIVMGRNESLRGLRPHQSVFNLLERKLAEVYVEALQVCPPEPEPQRSPLEMESEPK